jgi:hypothetical protein
MKQFGVITVKISLNYRNTFEKWSKGYISLSINLWIEMIMLSEIKYKKVLSLGCSNCVAHAYKVTNRETLHTYEYGLTVLHWQQILTDILPLIFFNYSAALEGLDPLIFEVSVRHTTFCGTHLDEWSVLRRDFYPITQSPQTTGVHAPGGIITRNPSKRAAVDPLLRPLGHWDRLSLMSLNSLACLPCCTRWT